MTNDETGQRGAATAACAQMEERSPSALRHADRIALLRAQDRSSSVPPPVLAGGGRITA